MLKYVLLLLLLIQGPGPSVTGAAGGSSNPCAGTVGCWFMNEGTGATFLDGSVNSNNIVSSSPGNFAWEPIGTSPFALVPFPNYSGSLAGSSASSATPTNFDGTTPFSVSMWVTNANTATERVFVTNTNSPTTNQGWAVETFTGGFPSFFILNNFPGNYIWVRATVSVTGSYHIATTYDGSQHASGVVIYVNGSSVSTSIINDTLTLSAASGLPIWIYQKQDGSNPNTGPAADLRIYSSVLTSGQVAALFAAGPQ